MSIPIPIDTDNNGENNTVRFADNISTYERQLITGNIGVSDVDWFEIEANSGSDSSSNFISAWLTFEGDEPNGDLKFDLFERDGTTEVASGITPDPKFEFDGQLLQGIDLPNGRYYLRVSGNSPSDGNLYTLQWDDFSVPIPRRFDLDSEGNNTRETAEDISFLERELLTGGIIATNDDWFEIEVDSGSNAIAALLTFNHDHGDLNFELRDSDEILRGAGTSDSNNEFILANGLSDGPYYLKVYSNEGILLGTEYSLQWTDFQIQNNRDLDLQPNNNTRENAEDISDLEKQSLTGGLINNDDEDWYQIEVDTGSNSSISAELEFSHGDGNLDFGLFDSNGTEIATSDSENDDELIEASDLSDGTYYLRVYSAEGTILANEYSLEWSDIEVVTEDPVTEDPVTEDPVTEDPVTEDPVTEDPVTEDPVTEDPVTEDPVTEDPVTEDPVTEDPVTEDPITGSGFDTQYYRFQNTEVPGTYLFVDERERQNILNNFPVFREEGFAFKVRLEPGGDDLVEVNRYRSNKTQGTYLFATADDFQSDSLINQSDFTLEGRAFYAYGAGSGNGVDYYRFENTDRSGTYLFPESVERESILRNFPSFDDQGAVWAVER